MLKEVFHISVKFLVLNTFKAFDEFFLAFLNQSGYNRVTRNENLESGVDKMKQHLPGALIVSALLLVFCMQVFAVDNVDSTPTESAIQTSVAEPMVTPSTPQPVVTASSAAPTKVKRSGPDLIVNGISIWDKANAKFIDNSTFISVETFVKALYPNAVVKTSSNKVTASGKGFTLTAVSKDSYLVVNNRYLYVPKHIQASNGKVLAPVRVLAYGLGASVDWNSKTHAITVKTTGSPLKSGDSYYNSESVRWLSRVISAESRNQPLSGQIAVGNVIMNRVNSHKFPNTVHDVIFQKSGKTYQFTTVQNGSINNTPSNTSIIAAKLCLEGANVAGDSLYFNRAGLKCWASRNRDYVTTIADHSFYQ